MFKNILVYARHAVKNLYRLVQFYLITGRLKRKLRKAEGLDAYEIRRTLVVLYTANRCYDKAQEYRTKNRTELLRGIEE